ncbi:zinc finger protein, predicted [Trypanosoma theileri]|uniref:Zinc finger protein, predicted n=1 Tax=Trypanosoma theileri TaxID=67003 RepID=A0A1X0NKU7_9TRYP|nr:zinc finger protein, predicted [Trypanosoma theileri]ORC85392.1 zinc finger protein, predicted [Trypanosoma theileri]
MRDGSDVMLEDEEYNFVLQVVRDRILQRERTGQPLVLRVRRDGDDGDQMTVVLGRVEGESGGVGGERSALRFATEAEPPLASLPFMAELGPLLLQALALQVIFGEQRRRMAAPLEREAVGRLQKMKLREDIIAQLEKDGQCVCSICQESFVANAEVCRLPCGHMFDVPCLERWLGRTRTCPNCRFMLQDVEQQYKDVVAPVWWHSGKDNEEEKEKNQCNAIPERRVSQRRNSSSTAGRGYGAPSTIVDENNFQQQQQQQPELPIEESTSFGSLLRGYDGRSRSGDMLLLETDDSYTIFPEGNIPGSEPISYTPVPPSNVPQRQGEAFRDRQLFEEAEITRTPTTVTNSFEPDVSEGRNLSEGNSPLLFMEEDPTPQTIPLQDSSSSSSSSTSSISSSSSLMTPPRVDTNDSILGANLLNSTLSPPSVASLRNSNEGSEYALSANMSQVAPRPPTETRATVSGRSTQTSLPAHPRETTVSGNARHAVYALRRHRVEEVHGALSPNRAGAEETITVGRPQRYRTGVANRIIVRPPALPEPSSQLSEERHRRRISNNSGSNNGITREEGQTTSVNRQQLPPRGNRRNLAQYEAIIRRGNRRRY